MNLTQKAGPSWTAADDPASRTQYIVFPKYAFQSWQGCLNSSSMLQARGRQKALMSTWCSTALCWVWRQSMACMPSQSGMIQT